MPASNARIASMFEQVADLLELEGANVFRVRAYRNASRTVGNYPQSMGSLVDQGADHWQIYPNVYPFSVPWYMDMAGVVCYAKSAQSELIVVPADACVPATGHAL